MTTEKQQLKSSHHNIFFFSPTAEPSDHKRLELVCTCTKVLGFKRHADIGLFFCTTAFQICIRLFSLLSPIVYTFTEPDIHPNVQINYIRNDIMCLRFGPDEAEVVFFLCLFVCLCLLSSPWKLKRKASKAGNTIMEVLKKKKLELMQDVKHTRRFM